MAEVDPIQELYRNSAAIKEAEESRCRAQNVQSALDSQQAADDFAHSEQALVTMQNEWRDHLAHLPSPEAEALLAEHGNFPPHIKALQAQLEGAEPLTREELQELIDDADPDVRKGLKLPK